MLVRENGKVYNIDEETGLVTEARVSDASEEAIEREELDAEFRISDRVEVDGDVGTIVAITSSVYGPAFGIRFDDGSIDEYPESRLVRTSVEAIDFERPIDELLTRFETYQQLSSLTNNEMDRKEKEARFLNKRAKSLVTDSKLPLSDQNDLHRVVLITGTDLLDMKETRHQLEESEQYLSKFNHFKIADEIASGGAVMGPRGDASWLDGVMDGVELPETTDADLAARAAEVVQGFSVDQLENDEFMSIAASFQNDYLQNDESRAAKFAGYLNQARADRVKELKSKTVEAKVDDNVDDSFDTSALYL